MLQRIQTVWMALATFGALFLYLSWGDLELIGGNIVKLAVPVLLILLGALSIFSYRNRKRQLMLNSISLIINVLLIGVLLYSLLNLSGGIDFPKKGIEPLFPLISIVSLLIANHYIRKDERLVKSVDRLR